MGSEIRNIIDQTLEMQQLLRDQQIELVGTSVEFWIPASGKSALDFYGDIDQTSFEPMTTQIVILWKGYKQLLSEVNSDEDSSAVLPLQAYAKLSVNIPKGSRVNLSYLNPDGLDITKTFVVTGIDFKNEANGNSKTLNLVPLRSTPDHDDIY